jgi:hypothetical protein
MRTRTCGLSGIQRAARGLHRRCVFPELLESVELAHPGQHHVNHDIRQIHENPFTLARTFDAHRAEVVLLGELHHAIGDRFDVAVGIAGGDDDDIGDIRELSDVHDFDVDGFHVVERGIDYAQQGLRKGGLGRRCSAAGNFFGGHFTPLVYERGRA